MAAVLAPLASQGEQLGGAALQKVEKVADEIGKNPAEWVERFLLKWGSISVVAGIGCYALYLAGQRASQGYLNDIDQTLGIGQEQKPTPPAWGQKAGPQPPPPAPPQQGSFNSAVAGLNRVGTASASANVASLQSTLAALWQIAGVVYGCGMGGTPAQMPSQNLGTQLAVAIMQTCQAIAAMEGRVLTDSEWSTAPWYGNSWGVYGGASPTAWLVQQSDLALSSFRASGDANWSRLAVLLNDTENDDNLKWSLNSLASALNLSQPYDLKTPNTGGNAWGVLGTISQDLSGIGASIEQGAATVAQDIDGALSGFASAITQLGSSVAIVGKALINLPRLLGDSAGYAGSWGLEMVGEILYPFLLGIGVAMLAIGSVMRWARTQIWPRVAARLRLLADAKLASAFNRFDSRFGIPAKVDEVWALKGRDAAIEAASLAPKYEQPVEELPTPETTPELKMPAPGATSETPAPFPPTSPPALTGPPPPPPGEPSDLPEGPEGPELPQADLAAPEGQTSAENPPLLGQTEAPSEAPVPPEGTTEAAEAYLGDHPSRAPTLEELRAQEEARLATLPPEPEPAPPTYRQRQEEREAEAAQQLVGMGEGWGET